MKKAFFLIVITSMILSFGSCKNTNPDTVSYIEPTPEIIYVDSYDYPTITPTVTAVTGTKIIIHTPSPTYWIDPRDPHPINPYVEINIGWSNALFDMSKDDLGQYIQKRFKCKFNLVPIDNPQKLLLLAAQDSLPDFFSLKLDSTLYKQLDEQKFLYHIDPKLLDSYPLLKRYFRIHDYLNSFLNASDDKKYAGLPFLLNSMKPANGDVSLYFRTDWAVNVNYETKIDTVDKAYQLLKKFREEDPDKNGIKDTYGISGFQSLFNYIYWVDSNSWVKETDPTSEFCGQYVPGYLNSAMFDAIKWWNRLIVEDIMPKDFYTQAGMTQLCNDQIGASYGNAGDYWTWEFLCNRFDPSHKDLYKSLPLKYGKEQTVNDVVGEFPPLKLTDYSNPKWTVQVESSITAISAKAGNTRDKVSRMFDFYEWTMTQEGADYITYGIPNKDYIHDKSGKVTVTLPSSPSGSIKKIWELYPSVEISKLISYEGNTPSPSITSLYPEWLSARTHAQIEKTKCIDNTAFKFHNIMTPTIKNYFSDVFSVSWFEDKINRIIAQDGGKTIEQGWNDLRLEVLDGLEGRKAIQEANAEIKTRGSN